MALFYTLWVRYGYNHFFNEAWWNGSTKDPKAPPEAPWWENFQDAGIITSVEEDPLDCGIKLFLMTSSSQQTDGSRSFYEARVESNQRSAVLRSDMDSVRHYHR